MTKIRAPAKTPRDIVDKLNRELNAVLTSSEPVDKLAALGIAATPGTPKAFGAQIKTDLVKYGKVVKTAGIKAECAPHLVTTHGAEARCS